MPSSPPPDRSPTPESGAERGYDALAAYRAIRAEKARKKAQNDREKVSSKSKASTRKRAKASSKKARATKESDSSDSESDEADEQRTTARGKSKASTRKRATASAKKARPAEESDSDAESKEADEYRTAARGIPRLTDPFCPYYHVFLVAKASMSNGSDAKKMIKSIPLELQDHYKNVYEEIQRLLPGVRKKVKGTKAKDLAKADFVRWINKGVSNARSDDAARIKKMTETYASSDPNDRRSRLLLNTGVGSGSKADRGYNNAALARMLCPGRDLATFDDDPDAARQMMQDNRIKVTGDKVPSFAWEHGIYNPGNLFDGLFRGQYPLRVLRDIFTSPSSALHGPSGRTRASRPSVNRLCQVDTVTVAMIAYAMVQARYALTSRESFNVSDGVFNYHTFYLKIIKMFSINADWTKETLRWFNLQVYGHEDGMLPFGANANNPEDSDDDDEAVARKQYAEALKAQEAAAAAAPAATVAAATVAVIVPARTGIAAPNVDEVEPTPAGDPAPSRCTTAPNSPAMPSRQQPVPASSSTMASPEPVSPARSSRRQPVPASSSTMASPEPVSPARSLLRRGRSADAEDGDEVVPPPTRRPRLSSNVENVRPKNTRGTKTGGKKRGK
ncbi:hypothetical protein FA95DRAFT_1613349 [Auriscalpium vulgare]|uniref:Uncharacterized protein n=1 Tax=Auriscalpium vulgare TaxID=40419 RepID=A0ACB8R3W7_9AGAM|nr:hypothetical protein FA95DRAFT_1613349 [Auriscalpium vulgare]